MITKSDLEDYFHEIALIDQRARLLLRSIDLPKNTRQKILSNIQNKKVIIDKILAILDRETL